MGKEERKGIIERIGKMNKSEVAGFVDVFRRLYNDLCPACKLKVRRLKGGHYHLLCDECKLKAQRLEAEMNEKLK